MIVYKSDGKKALLFDVAQCPHITREAILVRDGNDLLSGRKSSP